MSAPCAAGRRTPLDISVQRRCNGWSMSAVVERKLGAATSALYAEVGCLVERVASASASHDAKATRLALARLGLDILCGKYHDYRAGAPNPKGDLIEALRAVPPHATVAAGVSALIRRVLLGQFEDGALEAQRYVARVAPSSRPTDLARSVDLKPIELSARQWRVFAWLYRYIEVYGQPPMLVEMTQGLDQTDIDVLDVLKVLAAKGAVARLGGRRGWVPLRAP